MEEIGQAIDAERIRELEKSLWRAETRFDRAFMEAILEPDFVEIGRSGRVYTRDEILAMPAQPIAATLPLQNLRVSLIALGVALLTYTSMVSIGSSIITGNSSSIWLRARTGWWLRFHQGTAVGS